MESSKPRAAWHVSTTTPLGKHSRMRAANCAVKTVQRTLKPCSMASSTSAQATVVLPLPGGPSKARIRFLCYVTSRAWPHVSRGHMFHGAGQKQTKRHLLESISGLFFAHWVICRHKGCRTSHVFMHKVQPPALLRVPFRSGAALGCFRPGEVKR